MNILSKTLFQRLAARFNRVPMAQSHILRQLCLSLLLGCATVKLSANSADFNSDGKADILFQNKTTHLLNVWFMDGKSFVSSAPITNSSGAPLDPGTNWKLIGVGHFDKNNPNRLAILWQYLGNDSWNGVMAVWHLTGSNNTVYDTAAMISTTPGSGWKAMAVGDFNGDGKSDIAFQYDADGQKAVWLMDGTDFLNAAVIDTGSGVNWRITATGDFAGTTNSSNGTADGKSDIFLTYYNPSNDAQGNNLCAIWFMNGLSSPAGYLVQTSSGASVVADSPDQRGLATGSFNPGTDSKIDIIFRHVSIGRHSTWFLSGYVWQDFKYLKPEPDPAWKMYSQDWFQSTWRHNDLYPSISAVASANSITLNFRIKPHQNNGVTIRKRQGTGTWSTLTTGYTSSSYTDNFTLVSGTRYEYEVAREGNPPMENYPARVLTGLNIQPSRGKVLVIVDSTVAANITTSLNTFTSDLAADGWTVVLKTDAPRHVHGSENCSGGSYNLKSGQTADGTNQTNKDGLKQWIKNNHFDAKGIVLVGHVTVPLSGHLNPPDGHDQHAGAWVADMWYGDIADSGWTEGVGTPLGCAWLYPHNSNNPDGNDGKFDNRFAPSNLTAFVGRIDFARLPTFNTSDQVSTSETTLLTRYFTKNHAFRTGATHYEGRGVAFSTFDTQKYLTGQDNIMYEKAFRNLSPLYGMGFDKIVIGDPYHQKTDSYTWGFLSGFTGMPDRISQGQPGNSDEPSDASFLEHRNSDLLTSESNVAFYLLLGSYFGDWLVLDSFMKGTLATPNYGLASVYVSIRPEYISGVGDPATDYLGGTHWMFHHCAVGDAIGTGLIQTINEGRASTPDKLAFLSILGDPTLRISY